MADAGVLGPQTCYFNDLLSLTDYPAADRSTPRQQWAKKALAATAAYDLIFADPDNGIRRSNHPVPSSNPMAVKHAYLGELAAFARRGQSLIVYHHADRTAGVAKQALRRLEDLAAAVPAEPIAAVRASRGTVRLFLIAAATRSHSEYLKARLSELACSPWHRELRVYWHPVA